MRRYIHLIHIAWLIITNPPVLFEKLQRLDWYWQMLTQWIKGLGIKPGERVLEVGCGPGLLTQYLAQSGVNAVGLDHSSRMVKRAYQRTKNGKDTISYINGDVYHLPWENGTFNHTIAASLINIIPDADRALTEMIRVTLSGGSVSLLVPSNNMSNLSVSNFIEKNRLTGFSAAALFTWATNAPKCTKDDLKGHMERAGLEQIHFTALLDGNVLIGTGIKRLKAKA